MSLYFLTEGPFTRHLASMIDLTGLAAAGFDVRVIDATRLLLPQVEGIAGELAPQDRVVRIQTMLDLQLLVATLTSDDAVIFLSAVVDHQLPSQGSVYECVASSDALLGAVASGHVPEHLLSRSRLHVARGRIRTVAGDIRARDLLRLTDRVARRSSRYRTRRDSGPDAAGFFRPLDHLWTGTMTEPISMRVIGPATNIRYLHTLDYDRLRYRELSACDLITSFRGLWRIWRSRWRAGLRCCGLT